MASKGTYMMKRRSWLAALLMTTAGAFSLPALAQEEAPDALVKRISADVLATIKSDAAIQAGSTMVRVGTGIFGGRARPAGAGRRLSPAQQLAGGAVVGFGGLQQPHLRLKLPGGLNHAHHGFNRIDETLSRKLF